MIDPAKITNFNRTQSQLEEFLLFCIVVAGKNSKVQAAKLGEFLSHLRRGLGVQSAEENPNLIRPLSPFALINLARGFCEGGIRPALEKCKMGQYGVLRRLLVMQPSLGTILGDTRLKN